MRRALLVAWSCLATAAVAEAQSAPAIGQPFVTGMAIVARETAPGPDSDAFFTGDRFDGSTTGAVAGVGLHLWTHWSVRIEGHLTDALTLHESIPSAGAAEIEAARRFAAVAVQFGFPPSPPENYLLSGTYDYERRDRAVLALAGRRFGARRVAVELLAGMGFISKREEATTVEVYVSGRTEAVQPELRHTFARHTRQVTAVAGGDLTVRLRPRLHAVAGMRAYRIQEGLSLRSGLGLRWTF